MLGLRLGKDAKDKCDQDAFKGLASGAMGTGFHNPAMINRLRRSRLCWPFF
jgi:hypothetical protein